MKTILNLALAATLALTSCTKGIFNDTKVGKGSKATDVYAESDFTSVELRTNADVEIYFDEAYAVEVEDFENLLEYINVYVRNNTLIIDVDDNIRLKNSETSVTIHMPNVIEDLIIVGSGDITLNENFTSVQKSIITGSGNININSDLNKIDELTITGSGSIYFQQDCTTNLVAFDITGSGDIEAFKLTAETIDCSITGSGNIETTVNTQLNANISGSGSIYYYGTPKVDVKTTGSGKVVAQ